MVWLISCITNSGSGLLRKKDMAIKLIVSTISASALFAGSQAPVDAALFDRGGGLIYDDVLDITWLQDANYAQTSGFDADGRMTWVQANDWANGLTYYDSVRDVTYDDWRLPTVRPIDGVSFEILRSSDATTDRGYAPTTTDGTDGGWRDVNGDPVSEMGHMYYVSLANLGGCDPSLPYCTPQAGSGLVNSGPFSNIQDLYWTNVQQDFSLAWYFQFRDGFKSLTVKDPGLYGWAVREGDVSIVPIPATVWLFGSGLIGLIGIARRKKS